VRSHPRDQSGSQKTVWQRRHWGTALTELREAPRLDPEHFAPFPLDRYEPERLLGAGGFGVVFLCRNRLPKARLVVKALGTDELERDLAIVLEEQVCQYGPLSAAEARAVAVQIAAGLQAAHARNILHPDVKPGNILIRPAADGPAPGSRWQVKLIDFGLALRRQAVHTTMSDADALAKTTRGQSIAGTLDYAAPEQLGKLAGVAVGPHADVYGFGKTMCFAVFGTAQPGPRH